MLTFASTIVSLHVKMMMMMMMMKAPIFLFNLDTDSRLCHKNFLSFFLRGVPAINSCGVWHASETAEGTSTVAPSTNVVSEIPRRDIDKALLYFL